MPSSFSAARRSRQSERKPETKTQNENENRNRKPKPNPKPHRKRVLLKFEFPNQDATSSFGCKSHPSAATQRQMAEQLTGFLRHELGW
jgi:hypothetical protein